LRRLDPIKERMALAASLLGVLMVIYVVGVLALVVAGLIQRERRARRADGNGSLPAKLDRAG
jgi:hypothetical protein